MRTHHVIYPSKIYFVDHSRIQDGTVDSFHELKVDPTCYLVPRRGQEGVIINRTEEPTPIQERSESGLLVTSKILKNTTGANFVINLGRWDLKIEALMTGGSANNVKDDTKVMIQSSVSTDVRAIDYKPSIFNSEFAVLFEMLEDKTSGIKLYCFMPKVTRNIGDREMGLNNQQIASQLSFVCLALSPESPDEVGPAKDIFSEVTEDGLIYFLEEYKTSLE